jgi:HSP20 family protein
MIYPFIFDNYNSNAKIRQMKELENAYELKLEVPGFSKEDIDLSLDDGIITISGKNPNNKASDGYQTIYKSFTIKDFVITAPAPKKIKESEISAKLLNGILTITMPKQEKEQKKTILIEG